MLLPTFNLWKKRATNLTQLHEFLARKVGILLLLPLQILILIVLYLLGLGAVALV